MTSTHTQHFTCNAHYSKEQYARQNKRLDLSLASTTEETVYASHTESTKKKNDEVRDVAALFWIDFMFFYVFFSSTWPDDCDVLQTWQNK